MDQTRTGALIRALRQGKNLTQRQLADTIGVSDKAVSKWERGCGAPDISLLPRLSQALGTSAEALLRGDLEENDLTNGNMKRVRFCVCPHCGNLLLASDAADVTCCGQTLQPLTPQTPDDAHRLSVELSDGEWYLTSDHPMRREHYLSFAALVNEDTVVLRRLYPEWGAQTRAAVLRARHAAVVLHAARAVRAEDRRAQKVSRKQQRRPREGTPLLRFWMHYAMPVTL